MRSILAVDDSPSMRKMVAFTLAGAGFRVVEAVDGGDALEKAQLEQIDLVLADQNMPRLDGIGPTRKLREDRSEEHTPEIQSPPQPGCPLLPLKKKNRPQ